MGEKMSKHQQRYLDTSRSIDKTILNESSLSAKKLLLKFMIQFNNKVT